MLLLYYTDEDQRGFNLTNLLWQWYSLNLRKYLFFLFLSKVPAANYHIKNVAQKVKLLK